jgi:hypothetical protein
MTQLMLLYKYTTQTFIPLNSSTYENILPSFIFFKKNLPRYLDGGLKSEKLWFSRKYKSEMQDIHDTQ